MWIMQSNTTNNTTETQLKGWSKMGFLTKYHQSVPRKHHTDHMPMPYLGVRLYLISPRHSICGLVLGVLQIGKILCVATQIPYTWFLSFLRGLWTLSVTGTVIANVSITLATITDPLKFIKHDLGTGKNWPITELWLSLWPIKPTVFMRAVQMKPFGLPMKVVMVAVAVPAAAVVVQWFHQQWQGLICGMDPSAGAPKSIGLF